MVPPKPDPIQEIYQREGRRVFATLVRVLGSFELAEDALHNAFVAAAEGWPREGIPKNPVAWLVSAGRFKAIDQLRRQQRMTPWSEAAEQVDTIADDGPAPDEREVVEDDRLRLIFTCCHPSLSEEGLYRVDLARSVRAYNQGHRACLLADSDDAGTADRAGEGQDSRCGHSVPGPR